MGLFGAQLDHAHDSYIYTLPGKSLAAKCRDKCGSKKHSSRPQTASPFKRDFLPLLPNRCSNQSTKSVLDAMWSPCLSRACFMCAFLGRLGRALGELGGGCGVVVPDAFSCRSMPEWAAFLEAVTQNRNQNFQEDPLLALHAQDVFLRGCSTCI